MVAQPTTLPAATTATLSLAPAVVSEAVTHPGGPLVILGGAGTGKTATLAARFA